MKTARALIIVAAVLGAAGMARAAGAAGQTLIFVERATTDAITVHGGPKADNVGDVLTFANDVFDARNARKVGADQGYCVRTVLGKANECHWTLTLAKGQIMVDGPFYDDADSVLAVTGGTDAFEGARGQMHLHARDAKGSAYDFRYQLK